MRTANTVCREPLLTVRQKPGGHSAAPRVGGYKNLIQLVVTDGAETDRRADIARNAQTVAEAIEATTVVSLIGEAWSPNIAPAIAAPSSNSTGNPSVVAIGIAIGIMIANVPQLEPTEKAMNAEVMNINGASRGTATASPTTFAT